MAHWHVEAAFEAPNSLGHTFVSQAVDQQDQQNISVSIVWDCLWIWSSSQGRGFMIQANQKSMGWMMDFMTIFSGLGALVVYFCARTLATSKTCLHTSDTRRCWDSKWRMCQESLSRLVAKNARQKLRSRNDLNKNEEIFDASQICGAHIAEIKAEKTNDICSTPIECSAGYWSSAFTPWFHVTTMNVRWSKLSRHYNTPFLCCLVITLSRRRCESAAASVCRGRGVMFIPLTAERLNSRLGVSAACTL